MRKYLSYLNFEKIWLALCLFISASAIVYFLYALNWLGLIASTVIAVILYFGLKSQLTKQVQEKKEQTATSLSFWIYAALSWLASGLALILVIRAQTDAAIISPWTVINPFFFVAISTATILSILALNKKAAPIYKKIILTIYYFNLFSIAAIVYRLGYGFDPFIHQAAMAEISQYGYILPKTPYYIGNYSLIILIHKISGLSLHLINQWILPLVAALSLPHLLPYLHHREEDQKISWLASLMLLIIGFSPFIANTPQNFSYLLLLATVIFLYKKAAWPLSLFSSLATLAVHPLAGLPALLIVVLSLGPRIIPQLNLIQRLRQPIIIFIASLLSFCLTIWAAASFGRLTWQSFNLSALNPIFSNSEGYLLNLSYFFINNYFWLLFAGALLIFFKRFFLWPSEEKRQSATLLGLSALAAISAYLISRGFEFPALIAYEQGDYAERLPIIALIILMPLYWEILYQLGLKTSQQKKVIHALIVLIAAFTISISVYGSYPRWDNYYNSRGYSTSAADIIAVKKAENLSQGEAYITLANQQASAAALSEFGFRRYLKTEKEEIYFYPIPTGGPLYQYYLKMVYDSADRKTMKEAMDFANVKRAYLIINKYWWASNKIIAEAKLSADYFEKINQGEVYLFEYRQ
jgi:hypothetical protein